jgi:hypothetical protein
VNKIYIPSDSADRWKDLLAEPKKQWKKGYSARTLAYCWQEADGFPESIVTTFQNSKIDLFENVELLFTFPEYKIPLPGGKRESQNDIYVIAKSNHNLISIMIEGKVSEPFDKTVLNWISNSSENSGKQDRLNFLLNKLNLNYTQVQQIRYQLLHRTVSAIIEAQRIGAKNALMLVHSFSQTNEWFDDFAQFVKLFGLTAIVNSIVGPYQTDGINFYFGWTKGDKYYLTK